MGFVINHNTRARTTQKGHRDISYLEWDITVFLARDDVLNAYICIRLSLFRMYIPPTHIQIPLNMLLLLSLLLLLLLLRFAI